MSGTLPIALTQQFDIDGTPLAGARLYFYQVGTVATPQDSYQDYALTLVNPNPLICDQYGRLPMFYLADGAVHVRLTDASGVVVFDYASMQVIGPSSGGGGGGGGGVDPSTIASTGDFKWRPTSESLTGWIKANGTSIGNAFSGANQRANADTQALFVYLWNNFNNAFCPVGGGRGASALADFNAAKGIGVPDLRGRSPFGLDDMGATAAGRIATSNVSGGWASTSPAASGGENYHVLTTTEAPTGLVTFNDAFQTFLVGTTFQTIPAGAGPGTVNIIIPANYPGAGYYNTNSRQSGSTLSDHGGNTGHNNMPPFTLGTWYTKL